MISNYLCREANEKLNAYEELGVNILRVYSFIRIWFLFFISSNMSQAQDIVLFFRLGFAFDLVI